MGLDHRHPAFAFACLAVLLASCSDHVYIGENGLVTFALTSETPPFVEIEGEALYIVESRVEFPLKVPSETEMAALFTGAEGLPWERQPWVRRGDYEVEIDWALISLEEDAVAVTLTVNGFSEFTEYVPGFAVDDEEVIPEFAQYERSMILEPLERRFGTIREEQVDEIAADLATVVNGVTNANTIVHPDSQSSIDPRAIPFVPSIVPALVGFRAGLRASGSAEAGAPNIVVEMTVRVRDENGKIVDIEDAWVPPAPAQFMPSSLVMEEE